MFCNFREFFGSRKKNQFCYATEIGIYLKLHDIFTNFFLCCFLNYINFIYILGGRAKIEFNQGAKSQQNTTIYEGQPVKL